MKPTVPVWASGKSCALMRVSVRDLENLSRLVDRSLAALRYDKRAG
jgi:hypothetical protein